MHAFACEHIMIDLLNSVDRIDLFGRLVIPNTHDARKPQREAALVQIAGLNDVERHLEYDFRLNRDPMRKTLVIVILKYRIVILRYRRTLTYRIVILRYRRTL